MASAVQPRIVPLRPAHPEREDDDEDDLAISEGDAVEARVGEPVVVLDEEAVDEVDRVVGGSADDPRPGEGDHLASD